MRFGLLLYLLLAAIPAVATDYPPGQAAVFGDMLVIDKGDSWYVTNIVEHKPAIKPAEAEVSRQLIIKNAPQQASSTSPADVAPVPRWPWVLLFADGSYHIEDDGQEVSDAELTWALERGLGEQPRYLRAHTEKSEFVGPRQPEAD